MSHESAGAPSSTGSVMLDIGDDTGAIVIVTGVDLAGREIEARPAGAGRPVHAGVLERVTAEGAVHAVVIPGVTAGRYSLWMDGAALWGALRVRAGAVTELDLRQPQTPSGCT